MEYLRIGLLLCGMITVAVSDCPAGWLGNGGNCYHFSTDKEDWPGAMQMCELMDGTLIEINDAGEDSFVSGQVASRTHYQPYIALTDVVEENVWFWMVSRASLTSTGYTNWAVGEPNNHGGDENCVTIKSPGNWTDDQCANHHHYICEKAEPG